MKRYVFCCLMVLGVLVVPAPVRCGEKSSPPPTAVLRVRSIDSVLENARFLATLAGKEDFGQQLEGLIKSKVGPKGLEGVDTKRAFGAYARFGEDLNDIAGVAMIPIADEKAFLGLLENLNYKTKREENGIYIIQQDQLPIDIGFRFAHKYAYVTALNLDAISPERLLKPEQVFPKGAPGLVSGSFRLDQVPKPARDLAIAKLEEELSRAKDKAEPGETAAQKKLRLQFIDLIFHQVRDLIRDGAEWSGYLDINRKDREVVVESQFTAKEKSNLAKNITGLAKMQSQFAGLVTRDMLLSNVLRVSLPAELRQSLNAVLEEGKAAALEKEKNPRRRQQAEALLAALEPTLKSGELDLALGFLPTGNGATMILGLGIKEGEKLHTTLRRLLENLPAVEKEKITFDVSEVNGIKIHRVEMVGLDGKEKQIFGEKAQAYLAIGKEAALATLGEGGLAAIKRGLELKPGAVPVVQVELSFARMVQLVGTDQQKQIASKIFTKEDPGRMRLSVEGGPALRFRLSTTLGVLQYGAAVGGSRDVRFENRSDR